MSVDLEAIAQRGRCDVSSLRLAVPLLEQGYSPPFLARYRRDELGGLDESSLWLLANAMQTERQVQQRREELVEAWQSTPLRDPAIGLAVKKSSSLRMLNRLGRRLKHEAGDSDDSLRLAVRVLNPHKGDGGELTTLAQHVEGIKDPEAAVAGIDQALARRLAGDPRMIAAAVRWLAKNAKIHVATVHDPHLHADEEAGEDGEQSETGSDESQPPQGQPTSSAAEGPASEAVTPQRPQSEASMEAGAAAEPPQAAEPEPQPVEMGAVETGAAETGAAVPEDAAAGTEASATTVAGAEPSSASTADQGGLPASPAGSGNEGTESPDSAPAQTEGAAKSKKRKTKSGGASGGAKKQKKISPRQRRRRWLVSVLKPLEGKRFASDKLSAFQIVMLGRALRSQVAQCSFEYDATKLVAELQRTASSINRNFESQLRQIVLDHEADIREAAEAAWWDDLHEKASARLVTISADHLRNQVNRGGVDAKVVMAIDAVGPRTAATSIVCADGRILHNEDLPCQLSSALRSQAVARMGELIHSYHVDLIVVSNGPSRRASLVALGDLITQSPEKSVRWTLADRNGADVYAGSTIADEEMRTTPRRFRAAAWLAFSVLQPAQALAKIDPLKLRLSSFQRELSDDSLRHALEDVMVSGASRGGVDVNSAPVSWLVRLPGVSSEVAQAIDEARRQSLFRSREAVSDLAQWEGVTGSRQALPFLRVFGSDEVLDGTLIHPDDYPLAKKLAAALGIELPPPSPPGYEPPDFSEPQDPTTKTKIAEAPAGSKPIPVEDFTNAGDRAREFAIEQGSSEESAGGVTHPAEEAEQANEAVQAEVAAESPASAPEASAPEASESPGSAPEVMEASGEEASGTETAAEAAPEAATEEASEPAPPVAMSIAKEEIPEPIRRPKPERAKVDKCVKEWQIGARRAHQLVQWLCDPFGDSDLSGNSPAVLTSLPSTKSLKTGDMVIGVVVGVMPFGVFVELAPDCSGLVHVSRVSDAYVEDLHEAVQVGDVITAWVTGIDEKRRRVALSAVSPEREAELEEARRQRDQRFHPGGPRQGGRERGAGRAKAAAGAAPAATGSSGPPRGGDKSRGDQARAGGGRAGGGRGAAGRDSRGRADSQGGRGGRGAGRGGDARSGGRGREKKPESYRVVSKPETRPITDAMQKGEEPMRSFGDLLQFFGKTTSSKPESEEGRGQQQGKNQGEGPETSPPTPVIDADVQGSAESTAAPTTSAAPTAPPLAGDESGSNGSADQTTDDAQASALDTSEPESPSASDKH